MTASLGLSMVFAIINIFFAPTLTELLFLPTPTRIKSDYVLMLVQCIIGIVALFLPSIIAKRMNYETRGRMSILYMVFLYCSIYLGEVRDFYNTVPHWDTILHTFSGAMLGVVGFIIVNAFNDSENVKVNLSPGFVALFAFSFAITIGILWEVWEFTTDSIFKVNMQRFMMPDGTPLVGRAALMDTMKDIIVDCVGALITATFGFLMLAKDRLWLLNFRLRKKGECDRNKEESARLSQENIVIIKEMSMR